MYILRFVHKYSSEQEVDEFTRQYADSDYEEMMDEYRELFDRTKNLILEHIDILLADKGIAKDIKSVMADIRESVVSIRWDEPVEIMINGGREFIINEEDCFHFEFLGEEASLSVKEKITFL